MKCGVWNQMKIWSSHLLDNLSNCLMNLKHSGDSNPRPLRCRCSALTNWATPVSYEVTQLRAEVMGSNPVESPECFSVFFFPCYLGIPLRGKRTLVVFSKFRFFFVEMKKRWNLKLWFLKIVHQRVSWGKLWTMCQNTRIFSFPNTKISASTRYVITAYSYRIRPSTRIRIHSGFTEDWQNCPTRHWFVQV